MRYSTRGPSFLRAAGIVVGALLGTTAPLAGAAVGADETNVVAIAIVSVPEPAVGTTPPATVDPGALDPQAINPGDPTTLGGCDGFLAEFLGNTEYLQPLLDFVTCSGGGWAPDYVTALAGGAAAATEGVVEVDQSGIGAFVLGATDGVANLTRRAVYACQLQTGVSRPAGLALQTVRTHGVSMCQSIDARLSVNDAATLSGRTDLVNFLSGATAAAPATQSGSGKISIYKYANLPLTTTLYKVKYTAQVGLPAETCAGDCVVTWVVLGNKNPNTGTSVPCSAPTAAIAGPSLDCRLDSPPFTAQTVH